MSDGELLQVKRESAKEALREMLIASEKYNGNEVEMEERLNDADWDVANAFSLYNSTPRAKTPLTISLPPLTAASDFLNQRQQQNKTKKIETPIKTSRISEILRNARNDIYEYRPSTAQLKKDGLIYSSPKLDPLPKISAHTRKTSQPVWSCPKCTFENDSNTNECVVCGSSDTDVQAPMTYQHHLINHVFVFGYQNSAHTFEYKQINKHIDKKPISPNLFIHVQNLYIDAVQNDWTEEIQSIHVYVPKGSKGILNRPAPATVERENNTNKTFVNVFIHDWLFYRIKPDENYELLKNPDLKIIEKTKGIEITKGDGISVYPITETWTKVQYHLHNLNDDKPSYSPDTGLIVLNDSDDDEQFCRVLCVDKDTNRLLILTIRFYRIEKAYNDYVMSVDKKRPGGKSRRRNTRKPRKHQRRRTKRRRDQYKRV
jgi:hypothetical protein